MLELVDPRMLSTEQLQLLTAEEPTFDSIPPAALVNSLWRGEMQLYQSPHGIILTEINTGGNGAKRLNLVRAAGKDMALTFRELAADLQHIASKSGCNAIETLVYSDKLAKALSRTGARKEATLMVLELSDG